MQGLDLIKEETFCISSRKWAKDYFKKIWPDEVLNDDLYAYCIYIIQHKKVEVVHFECGASVMKKSTMSDDFFKYINKFKPKKFKDYIFLLDRYTVMKRLSSNLNNSNIDVVVYLNENLVEATKSFQRFRSKTAEAIESLLEDTNGFIVWHHQLESILHLFIASREEVVLLRKGFNAKNPQAIDLLDKFRIDHTTTLTTLIRDRLIWINGTTTNSNINGAFVLYNKWHPYLTK